MALFVLRTIFHDGFPSFPEIKNEFKKQTGLELQLIANLNVSPLANQAKTILPQLVKDLDKFNNYPSPKDYSDNAIYEYIDKRNELNFMHGIRFHPPKFYSIPFAIEGNIVELESESGCFYFINSLHKVLVDLGGDFLGIKDEIDYKEVAPKHWKKLKSWSDYNWFNRPKK